MARRKSAETRPAKEQPQVSLLDVVSQRMRALEEDRKKRPVAYQHEPAWDETDLKPTPFAAVPFANQTIGRFLGGRGEYAQLAMLEDWLAASSTMSARLNDMFTAFLTRMQKETEQKANREKGWFLFVGLLIGLLIGVLGGLIVGFMMGQKALG